MSFFAKRLIAALLLAAYASTSVLSSAFHDHQHGAVCASQHCAKAKGASHAHRCRHHHHEHLPARHAHGDSQEQAGAKPEAPHQSSPPHDDDHCSSCHFLGLASVLAPPIEFLGGGELVSQVAASRPIAVVSVARQLWRSLAPPSQG